MPSSVIDAAIEGGIETDSIQKSIFNTKNRHAREERRRPKSDWNIDGGQLWAIHDRIAYQVQQPIFLMAEVVGATMQAVEDADPLQVKARENENDFSHHPPEN